MENVIIMASGMGTRMRPLTEHTPKPLIKVQGIPMIETLLNALTAREVNNIYVVVGYLGNQFEYLKEKYDHLHIIYNKVYETVNNISSIYAARDVLDLGNCFICEADLVVAEPEILKRKLTHSCYYGKMIKGYSEDWVFEQNTKGIITHIGKGGNDCYNMTGIAYFTSKDAKILKTAIVKSYGKAGYETLFWDEVVNENLDKLELRIEPVSENQIIEIDTVAELEKYNAEMHSQTQKEAYK